MAHGSFCVRTICVSDLKSEVFCPCFPLCVYVLEGKSGLKSKVVSDMTDFLKGVRRGILRGLVPVRREEQDP